MKTTTLPTRKTMALASLLVLTSAAFALGDRAASSPVGTEITADKAVDIQNMVRVADAIDSAVDAKDWQTARALFTDEIHVDFTSLTGGEPATIPADALIRGWSGNLTANKTSFHLRGNHRVTLSGDDAAMMISHGYAWNRMEAGASKENGANPLWEVWGTYEHSFIRTSAGWQVNAMSFTATAQRGNDFVRDTPGD